MQNNVTLVQWAQANGMTQDDFERAITSAIIQIGNRHMGITGFDKKVWELRDGPVTYTVAVLKDDPNAGLEDE